MADMTRAQGKHIRRAMINHGVIIFHGPAYSAHQQQRIIDRMVDAGLVIPGTRLITSQAWRAADPDGFEAMHFLALGEDEIRSEIAADTAPRTRADEDYPQGDGSRFHGQALLHNIELSRTADGDLLDLIAEQILGVQELRDWRGARHMAAVRAAAEAEHNDDEPNASAHHDRASMSDDRLRGLIARYGLTPAGGFRDMDRAGLLAIVNGHDLVGRSWDDAR